MHMNIDKLIEHSLLCIGWLISCLGFHLCQFFQLFIQVMPYAVRFLHLSFQIPYFGFVCAFFIFELTLVFFYFGWQHLHEFLHLSLVVFVILLHFSDVLPQFLILLWYFAELWHVLHHLLLLLLVLGTDFLSIVLPCLNLCLQNPLVYFALIKFFIDLTIKFLQHLSLLRVQQHQLLQWWWARARHRERFRQRGQWLDQLFHLQVVARWKHNIFWYGLVLARLSKIVMWHFKC